MKFLSVLFAVAGLVLPAFHVTAAENSTKEPAASGKTEPLWELGAGVAVLHLPHYPAAAQNQTRVLPFPFFIYRGEIIRSDEKGILRGRLINSDRVELDLSFSGSLPVDADDNDAREGMEELDWLGEVGPRLQVNLFKTGNNSKNARVDFELPLRAVFSTDFSEAPDYRGIRFAPGLIYENKNLADIGVDLRMTAAANFATEKLMDYYYEVEPRFARANRPAFDADAGYLGTRFGLRIRRKIWSRVTGFVGASLWNFSGATNEESPLHLETFTYGVVAGLRISFFQSDKRVRDK